MPQQPAADQPRPPNIVVIFCDDLGYGDLGCYGSSVHDTPRLDRMAAEGTRFTNFYVPSPVCSPSRAGLLTGCYPKRVGLDSGVDFPVLLPGDPLGLSPGEVTIAELLRQQGYATKVVGSGTSATSRSSFPIATASMTTSGCLTAMTCCPTCALPAAHHTRR